MIPSAAVASPPELLGRRAGKAARGSRTRRRRDGPARARAVLGEPVGLFVDGGSLALALLLWMLVMGIAVPLFSSAPGSAAALLVAGYGAALLANVWRASRT